MCLPLAGAIIVPIDIRWNASEIVFGLIRERACFVVNDYFARVAPPGAPAALYGPLPDDNAVVARFYTGGATGGPRA